MFEQVVVVIVVVVVVVVVVVLVVVVVVVVVCVVLFRVLVDNGNILSANANLNFVGPLDFFC
jgi:hypothetical protein